MAIFIFSVIFSFFYIRLCYICMKLEDRIMGLEIQMRYIKSDMADGLNKAYQQMRGDTDADSN